MDGTFKSSPSIFFQLYTLHGLCGDITLPFLMCLLPDKQQNTYNRLFSAIKMLRPDFNPATINIDFEHAVINAARENFTGAQIWGCFFHFSQAVWRNLQRHGLSEYYTKDPDYALKMRCFPALAFVPLQEVIHYFEKLEQSFTEESERLFIDYFEETWIGRARIRNMRGRPEFALAMWNVLERLDHELPWQTNGCKGYHNAINKAMSCSHPTLFKFLETLKREFAVSWTKFFAIQIGNGTGKDQKVSVAHPEVGQNSDGKKKTF